MNTTNTSSSCAKDIMSNTLLTAYEGWTISRLADFFINRKISAAPVIASDHELVGVVSVSDVLNSIISLSAIKAMPCATTIGIVAAKK